MSFSWFFPWDFSFFCFPLSLTSLITALYSFMFFLRGLPSKGQGSQSAAIWLEMCTGITDGFLPLGASSFSSPVGKLLFWILKLWGAHCNTLWRITVLSQSHFYSWSVLLSLFLLLILSVADASFSLLETQGKLCIPHSLDTYLFLY